jgi:hypothetical protein
MITIITILTIITMIKCDVCECVVWKLVVYYTMKKKPCYMGGKHEANKWDLNWEHPFPRVLRKKRSSGIEHVDTIKFRVYFHIINAIYGVKLALNNM